MNIRNRLLAHFYRTTSNGHVTIGWPSNSIPRTTRRQGSVQPARASRPERALLLESLRLVAAGVLTALAVSLLIVVVSFPFVV